jgi:hypothetical protein
MAYSAAVRRSRSRAVSAWARIRSVRPLMSSAIASITPKVTTYPMSETAKVNRGGTKKKSNAAIERNEAKIVARRP